MKTSRRAYALRGILFLLLCTIMAGVGGCEAPNKVFDTMATGFARKFGVKEIRAKELIARISAGHPTLLIDVREPAEQSVSILAGAVRIRPGTNPAKLKQYQAFLKRHASASSKQPLIVVYCAGGYRSAEAIRRAAGKTPPGDNKARADSVPVLNLHGGIIAYANAGGPLVHPKTGKSLRVVHGYNKYWSTFVRSPARAVLKPSLK